MKKQLTHLPILLGTILLSNIAMAVPYIQPVRTMDVPAREVEITFDGIDDEASWNTAQTLSIFNPMGWDGTDADFSGYFKVCWDMHYLYFFADITDDIEECYNPGFTDALPFLFDNIELFVNLDTTDNFDTQYDNNTIWLRINRGNDVVTTTGNANASQFYYHWHNKEADNGWVVETGIPWTSIMPVGSVEDDIMEYIDNLMGFDVMFSDSDDVDSDPSIGNRDVQSAWDSDLPEIPGDRTEDNAWNNVTVFGIIDLIGTPAEPPPPPPPPYHSPYYTPVNITYIPSRIDSAIINGINDEASYQDILTPTLFNYGGYTGTNDFSGYCQTYWDSTYLYLYAFVRDDIEHDWTGAGDPKEFDNIEFFIDLDTSQTSSAYDDNAIQLLFCRGLDTIHTTGRATQSDFTYYAESTASGWKMEVAIPWICALPEGSVAQDILPYLNNRIGFDFTFNDSDGSDPDIGEVDTQSAWDMDNGKENEAWDNTYALGIVKFITSDPLVAIDIVSNINISLYPNPADRSVYLTGVEGFKQIAILNINGQVMHEIRNGGSIITVDVSNLQSGIYLMRIILQDDSIQTIPFAIQ